MGKQGKPFRKESAFLPPQHYDSSPPLQEDERAATSVKRGAGISAAGCEAEQGELLRVNVMDRVTFLFFSPPDVHKYYPGCKVKNQKDRTVVFKWTVQS